MQVREEQARLRPDPSATLNGDLISEMTYTRQVVKEILRLRAPAPMVPQVGGRLAWVGGWVGVSGWVGGWGAHAPMGRWGGGGMRKLPRKASRRVGSFYSCLTRPSVCGSWERQRAPNKHVCSAGARPL